MCISCCYVRSRRLKQKKATTGAERVCIGTIYLTKLSRNSGTELNWMVIFEQRFFNSTLKPVSFPKIWNCWKFSVAFGILIRHSTLFSILVGNLSQAGMGQDQFVQVENTVLFNKWKFWKVQLEIWFNGSPLITSRQNNICVVTENTCVLQLAAKAVEILSQKSNFGRNSELSTFSSPLNVVWLPEPCPKFWFTTLNGGSGMERWICGCLLCQGAIFFKRECVFLRSVSTILQLILAPLRTELRLWKGACRDGETNKLTAGSKVT